MVNVLSVYTKDTLSVQLPEMQDPDFLQNLPSHNILM